MTRWTFVTAFAICGLFSALGQAQDPWSGPAGAWAPPGIQQTGHPAAIPPPPGNPHLWHHQRQQQQRTIEQLLPDHAVFEPDPRLDLSFRETLARSWVRLDYLLWDLKGPSNVLLGAPVPAGETADLSGQDPFNLLPAVDRVQVTGRTNDRVIVPTLDGGLDDLNGLRGGFGIPTRVGTLEADVWALQQGTETVRIQPMENFRGSGFTVYGATTLLLDGVPSDTTKIFFNEGYRAQLQSGLFGTEGNWVFNPFVPNVAVEFSPIVGFRYVRLREQLTISGRDTFEEIDPLDPLAIPETITLDHRIRSRARNHVFGPQIGLRAQAEYWRLTFGADAKFFMGINRILNNVDTRQIYELDEEPQESDETLTRFAPMMDLTLTAKLRMTERFSMFVAYDLLFGAGFSRAYDNVYYNAAASVNDPPAIGIDSRRSNFYAHGLTIGGELFFR